VQSKAGGPEQGVLEKHTREVEANEALKQACAHWSVIRRGRAISCVISANKKYQF